MNKMYMVYHPSTNSAATLTNWYDRDDFRVIMDSNFRPALYPSDLAARVSVSKAIQTISIRYRGQGGIDRITDMKNFLTEVQIVEVNLSIGNTVFEYLFNIDKIA
jgi:hypothetical protein